MTGTTRAIPSAILAPALATLCVVCLAGLIGPQWAGAEAAAARREHVVRSGETLYSLARRYGVSLAALQAENGIDAPGQVQAGTRLRIPAGGTAGAKTSARAAARAAGDRGRVQAVRGQLASKWNVPNETAAIMGTPPKPDPPRGGSLLDIPLRGGGTLSPEHRDPGAVLVSEAAAKDEDFVGHSLGLRTTLPAGKDTQLVTTMGYAVDVSVRKNEASRVGYQADTRIGGLGYGLGLRHSF